MTSESLWNYHIEEIDDIGYNAPKGKSFEYRTKTTGKAPVWPEAVNDNGENVLSLNLENNIPLKVLIISNFWRYLDLPLISGEEEFDLKQGFKRTISWNKYRPGITTQSKNTTLDYMITWYIDYMIQNLGILINSVLNQTFKADKNGPTRNYFVKYYMPLVEIKDFNTLIYKSFFDQPVKSKQETY